MIVLYVDISVTVHGKNTREWRDEKETEEERPQSRTSDAPAVGYRT